MDMEKRIADILNSANRRFYDGHAAGFSATRERPWEGWGAVGEAICATAASDGAGSGSAALRVIDVGCGNMRFEAFLETTYPQMEFDFTCIDACTLLVPEHAGRRFIERDVVSLLLAGAPIAGGCGEGFDAAVAFGIMHHVPGRECRAEFLRQLCACVRPGGLVAVSFWQFASVPKLKAKAAEATRRAYGELGIAPGDLEEGDFFLGWADDASALRYCHSFDDGEIDGLLACVADSARTQARYRADTANAYVLLRA